MFFTDNFWVGVSKITSLVFHPALIPTWTFGTLLLTAPELIPLPHTFRWQYILMVFTCSCAAPILGILAMRQFGVIDSIHIPNRKQRIIPFIFLTVFYGVLTYLFLVQFPIGYVLSMLMLGSTLCLFFTTIITFFYKISAHSVAISGFLGFVLGLKILFPSVDLFYQTLMATLCVGAVMSARLQEDAHSLDEVTLGFMLGFSVCFGVMLSI